jgi:histidinol-phosphate/aromatic aminotransferase/cobyric acid decarboxylase-like protein
VSSTESFVGFRIAYAALPEAFREAGQPWAQLIPASALTALNGAAAQRAPVRQCRNLARKLAASLMRMQHRDMRDIGYSGVDC